MKSMLSVFRKGLQKTATSITRTVGGLFKDINKWDDSTFERVEAALIGADFGVNVSVGIVEDIRDRYQRGVIQTNEDIVSVAREDIASILRQNVREIKLLDNQLTVIMMVGVNGSGKTTTIGKLAHLWSQDGKKVMLAACDTFRAAAVEQLNLWGKRTDCHVVSSKAGADPSAVAYDAVKSALARKVDILLIDTAGRQHTKKGLMEELAKMRRSVDKAYPEGLQEVWLTIDASIGGNAIAQTREFTNSAGVTGLVLTKLDGTGKGGVVVAIQEQFKVPVFFAGLGESPEDLQPFDPDFYAQALFE